MKEDIARYNYNKVCQVKGKKLTDIYFGDWTTFLRDEISVSEAFLFIRDCELTKTDWS